MGRVSRQSTREFTMNLTQRLTNKRTLRYLLLCLALFIAYQVHITHLDDRLYFWIKTHLHADDWGDHSIWLPHYKVDIERKPVPGIASNLSGLTYDPNRKVLWAVTNSPNELFVLSTEGAIEARFAMEGFHDVEAVSYAGNNHLIIAEERRQSLVIIPIPTDQDNNLLRMGRIHRDALSILTLGIGNSDDNHGFEGLGYDLKEDRLFVVKERDPRQLLELSGFHSRHGDILKLHIRDLSGWMKGKVFATDLSSIVFDQNSRHLVLLSDESNLVIEMTEDGEVISYLPLSRGNAGLKKSVPQAEGVTLDERGNLYIISEPNLFYRFIPN
jgi:uncharacterized protein YjiK